MRVFLVVLLTFAGCAFFSETQKPDTLPVLVFRTPLPAVPADWAGSRPKIQVLFHVSRTGTVTDARFVDAPGVPKWESGALAEMMHWRFSPARVGEDSVPVWVRVPMIVQFNARHVINLAQLVCPDQASADSAYRLLVAGRAFETIVQELPTVGSGTYEKYIGRTDISVYSATIRDELAKLRENNFTKPLRIGNSFVIFKRLPDRAVSGV